MALCNLLFPLHIDCVYCLALEGAGGSGLATTDRVILIFPVQLPSVSLGRPRGESISRNTSHLVSGW